MPAMHTTVIRFGSGLWELIEREAKRRDVSVAEWVRTATAMRIGFEAAIQGDEVVREIMLAAIETERPNGNGTRRANGSASASREKSR